MVPKHAECGCKRNSASGDVTEDQAAWLDSRAAIRTAWMVYAIQGSLPSQEGLANNIHELRNKSKHGSNVGNSIRTKDDLWNWVDKKSNLAKHPLGQLSAEALEKFINGVEFRDYVKDGQRYQHVAGFYYGDLVRDLGYRGLFQVFAMFEMSSEYATEIAGYRRCGNVHYCECCAYAAWTCVCD